MTLLAIIVPALLVLFTIEKWVLPWHLRLLGVAAVCALAVFAAGHFGAQAGASLERNTMAYKLRAIFEQLEGMNEVERAHAIWHLREVSSDTQKLKDLDPNIGPFQTEPLSEPK